MCNKLLKSDKNGFTFLEVIVAVFIISVGVVGVIKVVPSIISSSSLNSSRLTAAYLAQEGIEIIRNIRDGNLLEGADWREGVTTTCASGCEADYLSVNQQDPSLVSYGTGRYLNIGSNGFYGYAGSNQTKFKRKITITEEGGGGGGGGSPTIQASQTIGSAQQDNTCSNAWKAQTFIPLSDHTITSVDLMLAKGCINCGTGEGCTLTVGIREMSGGVPSASDLISASTPCSSIESGWTPSVKSFSFGAGYPLSAPNEYAIVFRTNGLACDGVNDSYKIYYWLDTSISPTNYSAGSIYEKIDSSPWNQRGCPGIDCGLWDAWFQEWGTPPLAAGGDINVSVDVSWQERGKTYNFPVQERLYNWYGI